MSAEGSADILAQSLRDVSVDDLADLFIQNAKPQDEWMVGLELELIGHGKDNRPATHADLVPVLERLGDIRNMEPELDPGGALIGMRGGGHLISLEPGGQFEFATTPHRALKDMREELYEYCDQLREIAAARDLGFWAMGVHPFETRDSVPRVPKARYDVMRAYFENRGARALDMMHLTGSVQSTVDYHSEANLADKVRTAAKASPFLSALVAASPFTRGKPNGFKTLRYQIWLETDDERCGIWPEMLDDRGLTVKRYVARALQTDAFLVIRDGEYRLVDAVPYSDFAKEDFDGRPLTVTDFLDHLTTFFPEIRPKGYVEMRGADCVPPAEAVAIAGFWRGVLDHEPTRLAVDERLAGLTTADIRVLQADVARLGLEATSPVGSVLEVIRFLVHAAHARMSKSAPGCAECLLPLVDRADAGRSPADDMLAATSMAAALKFAAI